MANLIKSWRCDWFAARSQGYLRSLSRLSEDKTKSSIKKMHIFDRYVVQTRLNHHITLQNQLLTPSILDQSLLGMLASSEKRDATLLKRHAPPNPTPPVSAPVMRQKS